MRRNHQTRLSLHKPSLIFAALLALALPLALSAPAGAQSPTQTTTTQGQHAKNHAPQTWSVQVGQETPNQAIQGMAFLPTNVYVDAGDTVSWTAKSAEIHTVTFLAAGQSLESTQPFNPADPAQLFSEGGSTYDGHSYYNSGVMTNVANSGFPAVTNYRLTFPTAGTFTYYCLVHGAMMKGTVHVARAGTPYPFTQRQYNQLATLQSLAILWDGLKLWHETARLADPHHVYAGADDGTAMVMRFIQPTVKVRVGEKVTFINNGMAAPHTVTFGAEPANFAVPVGDPATFAGGDLNSGLMLPGSTFTVTFTKAGTFSYICALHDYMGMVGTVVVRN
ncbi:plastocyanin/azurin family copper-binding protein [Arthrobacter sp.]|uniref:plastocyanin/azurin family copper-binding protein n=1 Tax=Arthrobacter sp. TaxID=1667 RepID=UPI00258AD8DA|nr:plastocyanin/azurin family copper-binding protein [Arthrobacter sp.]